MRHFRPGLTIHKLEDEEYYDITIEVGNDPNVKIFRAHMAILNYRSPYLRRILSTNKNKNNGTLTSIKLPNFLPEVFHIILKYIYGGKLSFEEYDILDFIKILTTANELGLQELIPFIETFLTESKKDSIEQNFDLIYQISFENNSFLELQKYCNDIISRQPSKIFNSRLSSIPEKLLVTIIQNDKLKMNEVQVWEHVIKWGLAQNPELSSDPRNYSKEDFNVLKNTLQQCIPFIRFHNLTSKEFSDNIIPYKKILPKELYKNLLNDFLGSNYIPTEKSKPRVIEEIDETSSKKIDSMYITFQHAELISKWIDRLEITDKIKNHYEFKLLYRNEPGVSESFHKFCDNQPGTVTIIKLKDSNEILGGYNPIEWKRYCGYRATKDSFIFSFKNSDSTENHILSRVKDETKAIYNGNFSPSFGFKDLRISNCPTLSIQCEQSSYEKSIMSATPIIEAFEVFRIVRV
ncbi:carbohydrate-binding module family 13 protein [Rhizophagus clarus]|uniref:Carbohydrate-binding module family 13 protein n=1 Tax=Rhizophagus clarus TaxID=94130 RepID=A0A8H3LDC6_9GLOM|nr:carbohydrate-binding module family 13 protein [Rhizophagus clarus]